MPKLTRSSASAGASAGRPSDTTMPSSAMIRRVGESLGLWASADRGRIMTAAAGEERGSMSEPRLKAGLWVSMALRRADQAGRPGAVLRKGDPDAGGVLAVLRGREGLCVLSQMRTADG